MSTSLNLADNLLAFCIDQANPQNVAVAGGEPLPHTGAMVVSVIQEINDVADHGRTSAVVTYLTGLPFIEMVSHISAAFSSAVFLDL
ncbi:hypothetical protein IHC10_002301 [Escherichia coli]|nr:hypothetical protein [Escherichia coli]EES5528264.1 hypothetical protein [Escherichia coli]EEU9376262.1 hypothetical protein [Escherichia coli]EFF5769728.1 hypothetical protein [Escherichia coli]EFH4526361.1 hypothetical protein [Escherichia coli]